MEAGKCLKNRIVCLFLVLIFPVISLLVLFSLSLKTDWASITLQRKKNCRQWQPSRHNSGRVVSQKKMRRADLITEADTSGILFYVNWKKNVCLGKKSLAATLWRIISMLHCAKETSLNIRVKPVEHNFDRGIDQEVVIDCIDSLLGGWESPRDESNFLIYSRSIHTSHKP